MPESVESLRALLLKTRPHPAHLGYPMETRERVARWVQAQREAGARWGTLAEALGVSCTTLRGWTLARRAPPSPRPAMLPVVLESPPPRPGTGGGVLTSPRGYRVEGLGVEQLAALLERLG